jgi:5-(carboxyamino)imidazole ribonucleotide mutase
LNSRPTSQNAAPVAIIMGSRSDWPTMKHAADALAALGVAYEAKVVSAHRTPARLYAFATGAKAAGFKVIIVQMPGGVPVATLAVGHAGAKNAGLLAAQILALSDATLAARLAEYRQAQTDAVAETVTD